MLDITQLIYKQENLLNTVKWGIWIKWRGRKISCTQARDEQAVLTAGRIKTS